MQHLHTHLIFFWLEAGGEGSHPSLQHWAGGLEVDSSFPWLSPLSRVGNTIPRDGIGEVWGRNDDYFCECVDVWGVGLVCFSFGKRRTTVPCASASCSERHRRREGAGATLSPCPTGVTVLAVPCLCELVHMCIIFLYR